MRRPPRLQVISYDGLFEITDATIFLVNITSHIIKYIIIIAIYIFLI